MKKLETTRKIINGTVIRLHMKGFGYSKITLIENNEFYLAGIAEDQFFRAVSDGDAIEAYIWVEDVASYEFGMTVIGRLVSGPPVLFFSHTDRLVRSTERKCLTAPTDIPLRFFTFEPGRGERGITSEEIAYQTGRVILLTDREAAIKSDDEIGAGRFLKGQIEIDGESIELVGMLDVIHEEKRIYNVLFMGMSDKARNRILDYIFTIYRE